MGCGSSNPAPPKDADERFMKVPCGHDDLSEVRRPDIAVLKAGETTKYRNVIEWTPRDGAIKGLVFISHGMHEHALRYYNFAHTLTAKGYKVVAIDHASHGLSDGERAFIDNYNELVEDFKNFVTIKVQEEPSGLPVFLFGHSMGSLITILALKGKERFGNLRAIILSGCPLVTGWGGGSPFGIKALFPLMNTNFGTSVAKALRAVNPHGAGAPIIMDQLTDDEMEMTKIQTCPRHITEDVLIQSGVEFKLLAADVEAQVKDLLNVPFYAIHGDKDTVAQPKGSQFIFDNCSTADKDKVLEFIPDGLHELFFMKAKDEYITKVVDYIENIYNSSANNNAI